AELASRMQDGEHDLDGGTAELGVDVDGDAATVVEDRDAAVLEDGHLDGVRDAGLRLVDGVVDDLPDEMVESVDAGRADVHRRPLAHGLESLEHLDGRGVVVGRHALDAGAAIEGRAALATLPRQG